MHLNLKSAKKIDGDEESSTFKTKEGHTFKVMHKALSKGMREQIKGMPYNKQDDKKPQSNPKLEQSKVKKYAAGGPVDTIDSDDAILSAIRGPKQAPGDTSGDRQGANWSSRPIQHETLDPDAAQQRSVSSQAKAFNDANDAARAKGAATMKAQPSDQSDGYQPEYPENFAEGGYADTTTSDDYQAVKRTLSGSDDEAPAERQGNGWSSKPVTRPSKDPDAAKQKSVSDQARAFNAANDAARAKGAYAKGGKVQRFDVGGEAQPDTASDKPQAPVTINIGQPAAPAQTAAPAQQAPADPQAQFAQDHPTLNALGLNGKLFGGPGNLPPETSYGDLQAAGNMTPAGPGVSPMAASTPGPDGGQATVPGTEAPPAPEQAPDQAQGPTLAQAAVPEQQAPVGPVNPFQSAYDLQLKGAQEAANAQILAGKGKEKALQDYSDQQKIAQNTYANNIQDAIKLRQQAQAAIQDGHVDPNRFWNSKSTGAQITSIIGLLASGIDMTARPNAALDMFNKAVDRDIDAQKAEISKNENLLSAANEHFRNINSAAEFQRVMAGDLVSHQIDLAAAKATTPLALSQLHQLQGQIKQQQAIQGATIGAIQTLSSPGTPQAQAQALQTLHFVNPSMGKDYAERSVPGFGTSTQVIPNDIRNGLVAKQQLNTAAADLINFIKNKGSTFSLNDRNEAAQKAQVVQSLYREGLLQTVYKQGEQPLLDKVVNENPLSFVNTLLKTEPKKLQEIIDSNNRNMNVQAAGWGLKVPESTPRRPPILPKGK